MLHSRNTNNKINKLHERTLRYVYHDYSLMLKVLHQKKNKWFNHYNIKTLHRVI